MQSLNSMCVCSDHRPSRSWWAISISPKTLGFSPDRLMYLLPEASSRQPVWLDAARIQIEGRCRISNEGGVDGADQQGCRVHLDLFPILAQ